MDSLMPTCRLFGAFAFCFAVLGGCATVSLTGYLPDGRYCFRESKKRVCTADPVPTVEQEARAKQFPGEPVAFTIWVVRNTHLDAYGRVPLSVDGSKIETLPYTASRVVVTHGQHSIRLDKSDDKEALRVSGNAGEQMFAEVAANIGLFAIRFYLRRIAEDEGRRKVLASKLIGDVHAISRP